MGFFTISSTLKSVLLLVSESLFVKTKSFSSAAFDGSGLVYSQAFRTTASRLNLLTPSVPSISDSTAAANVRSVVKVNTALIAGMAAAIAALILALIVIIYLRRRRHSSSSHHQIEMTNAENSATDISGFAFDGDLNVLSQYQDEDLWIGEHEIGNEAGIFGDDFGEGSLF
jgi:hypothetical protein